MSHYYAYGPPQPGRYYQSQPPPPAPVPYYLDPSSFKREYAARLAELTVNSRPIIQSLSMLAQDYSRFADIVAQCIEAHIRSTSCTESDVVVSKDHVPPFTASKLIQPTQVPPWMKLPAFYLLDAISKNVFEPYAHHFVSFVIPLFLETYDLVDAETRHKMEEMLITWRNGAPQGRALFGSATQFAIERTIWGDSNRPNEAPRITKAQVLAELEGVLQQKEQLRQLDPYNRQAQEHIPVLHQLRRVVDAGVSPTELHQILQQLRSLSRAPQSASQPPAPVLQPVAPVAPSWPQSVPTAPSQPPSFSHSAVPPPNVTQPPSLPRASSTPLSISDLLTSLIKSGVVPSTSGTPVTQPEQLSEPNIDLERESTRAYRRSVLSNPIPLNTSGISKATPQLASLLYDRLTLQCKQCGLRFLDSPMGKQELDDHLDMHFRQNRKANQDFGRGHSRSWFVTVDDWIHDMSFSRKGKGRADTSKPTNPKEAAAAEAAKRDAELRTQYVVVPPGDEAKQIFCSICKEQMKSEFLEEDEDWVWKNAVMKDNKLYHATCHAEALTSTTSLAARLRSDLSGQSRSRSGTPERRIPSVSALDTPPSSGIRKKSESPDPEQSSVGVKRKAEVFDSLDSADSVPPVQKKVALS